MIVSTRIDNRLIHGQVVEAWVPHLKVTRLVVADDEVASDGLAAAAMRMAVPSSVEVRLVAIEQVDYEALASDPERTLLLFRDVSGAAQARALGLPNGLITVGNVHAAQGREPVTRSVFLSPSERDELTSLRQSGMQVVVQAVPSEKAVPL